MEILNLLWAGFGTALEPQNLLLVVVGCTIGLFIGAMPGLGSVNGVAILLPVTFLVPPTGAIIFLAALCYGAMYGGAISSIMLGIPGASTAVATTFDGTTYKLFVNGVEEYNTTSFSGRSPHLGSQLTIGKINNYFEGRIDHVTLFNRALSSSDITDLMKEVPILNLHLDEASGSTTFVDDSTLSNNASCSGNACPQAGVPSRMREGLLFDGTDDMITVPDNNALDLDEFTVGLWVKPTKEKSAWQPLIAKDNDGGGDRNYGLYIPPNSMQIQFSVRNSSCNQRARALVVSAVVPATRRQQSANKHPESGNFQNKNSVERTLSDALLHLRTC